MWVEWPFCDWLLSLSMASSGFIQAVAHYRILFLFKAVLYSIVRSYHILVVYSFINGHLVASISWLL